MINNWWINKVWYTQTNGIVSSIKRNYQCSKTMWMNLKTIMVSERRQTQKITCCMIPFTRNSWKDQKKNHSDRKQVSVCQGLAGERIDCKGTTQGNISGWQKFPYHDFLYLYHDFGGGGDTTIYSSENYGISLWSHVWKLKNNHTSWETRTKVVRSILDCFLRPHHEASGILLTWQGTEPCTEAQSLNHWTTRQVPWILNYLKSIPQ